MIKIAACMTAGAPKREWDIKKYLEVMQRISERHQITWVFVGSGEKARLSAEFISKTLDADIVDLVDKTSLRETGAVLKRCDVYLGGDTGPMHIAAAAGLKGVVLSCHPLGADKDHFNAPERFGPWQDDMVVLRPQPLSGCEHGCEMDYAHCINQITVDQVVHAMESIIRKNIGREVDVAELD